MNHLDKIKHSSDRGSASPYNQQLGKKKAKSQAASSIIGIVKIDPKLSQSRVPDIKDDKT